MTEIRIPVFTTAAQVVALKDQMQAAIARVTSSGQFILDREVQCFEQEFANYCGVKAAVGVGNGTDAIELALRAVGVRSNHEVITVANTAPFTGLAILAIGATPVFVDVTDRQMLMDPARLLAAVSPKTKAILPVNLYGETCNLNEIMAIARTTELSVVVDAAQAHATNIGAGITAPRGSNGSKTAAAFSFYPTKNLGGYGDGGAVITNDPEIADQVRRWRNGGMADNYRSDQPGRNSRLDELQAAILRVKLPHLKSWTKRRRSIAARYTMELKTVQTPEGSADHVYHLYPVRTTSRNSLRAHLQQRGIGSAIHYPWPLTQQGAFVGRSKTIGPLDITQRCCDTVVSLPLYPEITDDEVGEVINAVNDFRSD